MANENVDLSSIFSEIGDVMKQTDLSKVSAESTGFEDLPDGYYLAEVIETKIGRSKSSQKPMISLRLSVIDDGFKLSDNEDEISFDKIEHTKGRQVFKHYVIDTPQNLKRFVSDMKKFENPDVVGEALLPDEAWSSPEFMGESIGILSEINCRIWIHNRVTKKDDGTSSSWIDLVSFNQAAKAGLPVD